MNIEGPCVEVDLFVFATLTTSSSSPTAASAITVIDNSDGARVWISSCAKMNGRGGVERKLCINLNDEKGTVGMSNDKYFVVLSQRT